MPLNLVLEYLLGSFELNDDYITENCLKWVLRKDLKFSYKRASKRPL